MKKLVYLVFILVALFSTYSCKKDSTDFQIEYKIEPADNYIIEISYNDQTGNLKVLTDLSQLSDGTATISVTQTPFIAKLKIKVNNTLNVQLSYTLFISVNGQIKSYTTITAPPMTVLTEGQIEYTVN
jgi:hypothetical protein